jgi:hypothetical protein
LSSSFLLQPCQPASQPYSQQAQGASQVQPVIQSVALLAEVVGSSDLVTQPIHMYEILYQSMETKADMKWQIGKVGELEEVDEYRVEAMCLGKDTVINAVQALKK